MAKINRFEDMVVWQKARKQAADIFELTKHPDFNKDFPLKNQVLDSSGSVMDNIAEGFERGGRKEFIQFLSVAKGSNGEVKSQLHRIFDRKYIDTDRYKEIYIQADEISKMLSSLISYLKKSDYKGFKFNEDIEEYQLNVEG